MGNSGIIARYSHCIGYGMRSTEHRPPIDVQKPVKVFDLFCGCGGTSCGLNAAGMDIALGVDNDPDAERTFRANFPEADFLGVDIRHLPTWSLDRFVERCAGHPLWFSACAPCQPFSQQRRGAVSPGDERFGILSHMLRFVERYRPEFLFVENVPGLRKRHIGLDVFEPIIRCLQHLGYYMESHVVRSQDYGVPQRRARLVLLASRICPVVFPDRTHGPGSRNPEFATVADWIAALPSISAGETHSHVPNHRAARLSPINLQRIRATPPGGGWRDLPNELVPNCHKFGFTGYSDVYGRLRWDTPAPAMTTRCISYSNGRFGHPQQDRAISVREAACLQTFPADFVFTGSLNAQARQVGNAVPPLLAQRFGERVAGHAVGSTNDSRSSGPGRI